MPAVDVPTAVPLVYDFAVRSTCSTGSNHGGGGDGGDGDGWFLETLGTRGSTTGLRGTFVTNSSMQPSAAAGTDTDTGTGMLSVSVWKQKQAASAPISTACALYASHMVGAPVANPNNPSTCPVSAELKDWMCL